jgi:hypothetical protein
MITFYSALLWIACRHGNLSFLFFWFSEVETVWLQAKVVMVLKHKADGNLPVCTQVRGQQLTCHAAATSHLCQLQRSAYSVEKFYKDTLLSRLVHFIFPF